MNMVKNQMANEEIWNWLVSNINGNREDVLENEDGFFQEVINKMKKNNIPHDTEEIQIMIGEAIDYCL